MIGKVIREWVRVLILFEVFLMKYCKIILLMINEGKKDRISIINIIVVNFKVFFFFINFCLVLMEICCERIFFLC